LSLSFAIFLLTLSFFIKMDTSSTLFVRIKDDAITNDDLKTYYEQFGALSDCKIQVDKQTQKSRGFAFVKFVKASMVDEAMSSRPHEIKGITLEPRRSAPREYAQKPESRYVCKQIFVGNLKDDKISEDALKEYFSNYGVVEKVDIPLLKDSDKRRGFAVLDFDDYDPVDVCCFKRTHFIEGARVEVSKYIKREEYQKLTRRFGNDDQQQSGGIQDLIQQVLGGGNPKARGGKQWQNKPARRPMQQKKESNIPYKSKVQNKDTKGFQKSGGSAIDMNSYVEFLQGPPTLEKIMNLLNANQGGNKQQGGNQQQGGNKKQGGNKQQGGNKPQGGNKQGGNKPQGGKNNQQNGKPMDKKPFNQNKNKQQNRQNASNDGGVSDILSLLQSSYQQKQPTGNIKNNNFRRNNRQQSDNAGGNDIMQLLLSNLGQSAPMSNGSGPNNKKGRKGVWM